MAKAALAIHGGAGTILRSSMTAELEREYRDGLQQALDAGWRVLKEGGSALDAVESAVISLEDFHLFNAGRGSVFTHEGKNEMDAAIMDGYKLHAGAVAAIRGVRNPVTVARLVMERTEHVLLAADGANDFAAEVNAATGDDEYFHTDHRYEQLLRAREEGVITLDHTNEDRSPNKAETRPVGSVQKTPKSLGTVGAVACDRQGRLAAATSTGGMTNKKYGRVGDTPLIGLGTYADDTCAVSCTGHGEYFMLGVTAFDVAARMKYKGLALDSAAREAINNLTRIGGEGGLIAVDASGNISMPFNSDGMYRGSVTNDGKIVIDIY
ncbi:MAG: isoaspartyl peptidase/L-asparaginase [Pyrinomonadaceae bacterium]